MDGQITDEKLAIAKESKLIYLASPYSHPDFTIRDSNYRMISKIAAKMVAKGGVVFSPITYGHNLLEFRQMPSDWEFWFNFCVTFLMKCDKLVVCKMPGWENSVGVREEIEIAEKFGIEIEYIDVKLTLTDEEMDEFLVSIGGLVNGYYTDKEPIVENGFFSVNNGWFPIIKELIEDLIELGWNKQICCVKEKFGGLRFYINEGSDEIHNRIRIAENESYITCEYTGKPGKLRNDIGWLQTLCEEEYMKIKEHRANKNGN